jgi:hypothetical protein
MSNTARSGAFWSWQYYQSSLHTTRNSAATKSNLEPGVTDDLLRAIRQVATGSAAVTRNDANPPRVVLTWPLQCANLGAQQKLFAVASDDSGVMREVEFLVDDASVAKLRAAPYTTTLDTRTLAPGEHVVTVRGSDAAGNIATSSATVTVRSNSSRSCSRTYAQ